ncbi:MAG: Flp family type IVb pilin [Bradyrhizobium sp.]|nr:Flp family type IVb pilin [Bradyrhizobium sp.]
MEYALIAAGISIAIMATVTGLGTALNGSYVSVSSAFK